MFESSDWDVPPGPALAAALDGRGWAQAGDQDLVGALVATEQVSAWVAGVQAEVLAELARRRPPDPRDRSVAARGDGLDAPAVPGADEGNGAVVEESVRGPIRYSVFTADEVAAAVGWSWNVASTRLRVAVDLATRLPRVADALHAGQVDWPRARAISEATRGLGAEAAWRVADQGLRLARTQTVGQVRDKVTAATLAADPALASRRHARARTARGMVHHAVADGMAMFGAVIPAADAALAAGAVDALARSALAPDDPRTLEQARVDAFTDTLIAGYPRTATPTCAPAPASTPAPPAASTPAPPAAPTTGGNPGQGGERAGQDERQDSPGSPGRAPGGQEPADAGQEPAGGGQGRASAVVNITVPLTTLLGLTAATTGWTTRPDQDGGAPTTGSPGTDHGAGTTEESFAWWWPLLGVELGRLPGQVGRAGPVAAEQAVTAALQALAGGAPARWIVTGPSGTAWAATTPTYRRPRWLDHAIRTLDRICRAPGCRRPAEACDIDHVIPYPRGATTATNLTALCRHHHRMKTHAGWTSRLLPDRRVEWVSPSRVASMHCCMDAPSEPCVPLVAAHGSSSPHGRAGICVYWSGPCSESSG